MYAYMRVHVCIQNRCLFRKVIKPLLKIEVAIRPAAVSVKLIYAAANPTLF